MTSNSSNDAYCARQLCDEMALVQEPLRRLPSEVDEVAVEVSGYLFRLGKQPVHLTWIEYLLIRFLANRPYKAFTRKQIVASLCQKCEISEVSIDEHVRTLRDKLGSFSDYIQSVPYIGYRFKP